jgi:peptide/nickel transport system permease protein
MIIRLIPGNVIDIMAANAGLQGDFTTLDRQNLEHLLGYDQPVIVQYGKWVGNIILHGNLGNSLWSGEPVMDDIKVRWPVTVELGLLSLIITQIIAFPIGIYSALRQDTWGDYLGRSFAILCMALPSFWLGTLVIVYPAIWWNYAQPVMLIPFHVDPIGNLKMFIIPATILAAAGAGGNMRLIRTMMLETMRQDYIRTAWAKGLKERVVVLRHALKNALIPIITILGYQLPVLVGGAVIIENLFNLPGMGRLLVEATNDRDYTVVSAVMIIVSVAMVVINLLVDLTYGLFDPRIRYQ